MQIIPENKALQNFSADPIYFYDQSVGAVSWIWNFGDSQSGTNNFSDLEYPSHYYTDSGYFTAQLIVSNEFGCLDTTVKPVKINESFVFYTKCFYPKWGWQ